MNTYILTPEEHLERGERQRQWQTSDGWVSLSLCLSVHLSIYSHNVDTYILTPTERVRGGRSRGSGR